ncbi:MAG: hypothetical protein JW820_17915 [Spirochaetales bacterium]|nr:hypothetical protein [Spirochaetales bacterium]
MLRILHLGTAIGLLAAHAAFFLRGLSIDRGTARPTAFDRLARSLAQALLPAAALTGLLLMTTLQAPFFPHGFLGILPVAAIPAAFLLRLALRKRRQLPWLLPAVNLALIIGAMVTGFAARP